MGDLVRPAGRDGSVRRRETPPTHVLRRGLPGRGACLLAVLAVAGGSAAAAVRQPQAVQQQSQAVQQQSQAVQQGSQAVQRRSQAVQPSLPQAPPFTAGVELARLDIEVTDARGRPIRDLRAEEVRIEEGGVVRPAVLLQHVRAPLGSYAEAALRTIGGDVSTNRGAPRGRLYVFVFDQSHITPRNEEVAPPGGGAVPPHPGPARRPRGALRPSRSRRPRGVHERRGPGDRSAAEPVGSARAGPLHRHRRDSGVRGVRDRPWQPGGPPERPSATQRGRRLRRQRDGRPGREPLGREPGGFPGSPVSRRVLPT